MDFKKLITGAITGGILFFLLGWLIYGNLLAGFMKANPGKATGVDRTDMDFMYLAIGNLLSGLLLAYIFAKAGVSSMVNGFVTGGVLGFLMSASYDCVMYGTTFIASKKMIMADVIAYTVMCAVVGAIVALVMGKMSKAA